MREAWEARRRPCASTVKAPLLPIKKRFKGLGARPDSHLPTWQRAWMADIS